MSKEAADATGVDTTDPRVARREKLRRIGETGIDPWGSRFDERSMVEDVRRLIPQIKYRLPDGTEIDTPNMVNSGGSVDYRTWKSEQNAAAGGNGEEIGPQVRVAGRIMLMRPTGKLIFLNLRDWTGEIQIFIGKNQVGEEAFELAKLFDLGDLIGVDGRLGWTNTGELTVFAEQLHFHTKMLEPAPDKHAGLHDPDLRQRMRYADLAFNDGVREVFLDRTRIVKSIRQTLDSQRFVEVEGPTLHAIAGGAAARPFKTHHNALDMPLFMRIALELHLKRLMVGGIERVYELGRVFRNEGVSPRHNPEFTMLEAYQAYGDYGTMMELTEQIISNAIEAIGGGMVRKFGDQEVDFTPPFARRSYDDLILEHTGVDPADEGAMRALAKQLGLETANRHADVIKNEIFEEKVEDLLVGPVFVIDYPASMCPLTKRKVDQPEVAERFELFICGMELANAYTELNDPDLQEQLFRTQLQGLSEEDSMAHMDHDFVRALRYAMPPAGGLGIGIDRLVMLLTGQRSIRDVILFPLLRPETFES
ncbi:lysine--tRNA ligase [Candidatus Laterigemmans baculatus]|uniref:lysine--tRNA ligase n=1 Tax=Candidatus Laterigemmans baculatus TaxID=2770505 RepID=UPI0013DD20F3|nr:lysine--tRNA ligase [Candidatus Laterigemmans baculatus]